MRILPVLAVLAQLLVASAAEARVAQLTGNFYSHLLGNERAIWAYFPPRYDQDRDARFPVVYMQDGQNLFGGGWRVDEALDRLYAGANPPRQAIVIGVAHMGDHRVAEFTPPRSGLYLRFLREELKPQVDRFLRSLTGPEDTGLIGSSMGGLVAAHAACTEPSAWGFVGIVSPSVWWDDRYILDLVPDLGRAQTRPARIYVDSGEDGRADAADLATAFRNAGYREPSAFKYVYAAGDQHNEAAWARRFPAAIRFLLGD